MMYYILQMIAYIRNPIQRHPHRGHGRKVLVNHKLHWTVLASYNRVIKVGNKAYQPKALLMQSDGTSLAWEELLKQGASLTLSIPQETGQLPRWEGDQKLIDTLSLIQNVGQHPSPPNLLEDLFEYTARPGTYVSIIMDVWAKLSTLNYHKRSIRYGLDIWGTIIP